tara:strand:- start:750 stop:1223 length:474 start_codon:yes stop_codon:yes gene_type:complete
MLFLIVPSAQLYSQAAGITEEFISSTEIDQYAFFSLQDIQNVEPQRNSVIAVQVGLNNVGNVYVKSSKALVNLSQYGNNNVVDLNYDVYQINSTIAQQGSNNSVVDYVFSPNDAVNTFITQNGNNLSVQKFGANSITNGLQINMTGSDKTIIVNSFK